MGRLTTHVLDTAQGKPGKNIEVRLFRVNENGRTSLLTITTNSDGRCDKPLLQDDAFQSGVYELDFHVGAYFSALNVVTPQPPFLDVVTLRFGVADAREHFHVPLVVTPWSYCTYRGS